MLDAMMPEACTNMLYSAAETVRERTALELREFQATWIGWAAGRGGLVSRHFHGAGWVDMNAITTYQMGNSEANS